MNHSTTAILADDSVRVISCTFEQVDADWTRGVVDNESSVKTYSYKSMDASIQVGDLVVVEASARDARYSMKIVRVVEVDVDIDFDSSIQYKWIIDKIDTEKHERVLAKEKQLLKHVQGLEREHKKSQLKAALAQTGVVLDGLSLSAPIAKPFEINDVEVANSEDKDEGFHSDV